MKLSTLIIIVLLILGAAYGYVSGVQNQNPNPIDREEGSQVTKAQIEAGRAWRPSPVWLPSYLVATVWRSSRTIERGPLAGQTMTSVGYGLTSVDNRGYTFGSSLQRTKYEVASAGVGAFLGLLVAVIILLATGQVSLRKPQPEAPPAKNPPTIYP